MLAKEDNSTPVHSSSPSCMECGATQPWLPHKLCSLGWLSLLAFTKSILPQINAAINKRVQSQSPLCLKRRATFPHTGSFVWSNLPSLVWGRWSAVGLACLTDCWSLLLLCLLGDRAQAVGGIYHLRIFRAVDQMAVNLVLILEHDLAKTASPHGGIRRIEMLNMLPAPSSWLHCATEGLCLYLAGQQELV